MGVIVSDFYANGMLNIWLRHTPLTVPGPMFLALLHSMPAKGAQPVDSEVAEQEGSEPTGYERQELVFAEADGGVSYTDRFVRFARATADWGDIRAYAIINNWVGHGNRIDFDPTLKDVGGGLSSSAPASGETNRWLFAQEICPRSVRKGQRGPRFKKGAIRVAFCFKFGVIASDYWTDTVLDATLIEVSPTVPEKVYLALLTKMPAKSDTTLEEVISSGRSNTGYKRTEITFAEAVNQATYNDEPVDFDDPKEDWSTKEQPIVAVALTDQQSGGNWFFAIPICPLVVSKEDGPPSFAAGSIRIEWQRC